MADRTEDPTVDPTLGRTAHLMADRTAHPMVHRTPALIMVIGSAAGRAGFMAIATSGIASGIAGIRTATTGRAGTFAALTGSQRH
jgi:hypothetical protein